MILPIVLSPITSPPDHANPVVVWDIKGGWGTGWFRNDKWCTQSGAVEHLFWWSEMPVVLPGGAHYYESERP